MQCKNRSLLNKVTPLAVPVGQTLHGNRPKSAPVVFDKGVAVSCSRPNMAGILSRCKSESVDSRLNSRSVAAVKTIDHQKVYECFENDRAAFKMLAGADANDSFRNNHLARIDKELDHLSCESIDASSMTFVPHNLPFYSFYDQKTIGFLVDTADGSKVHESNVRDCGSVPTDSEGRAISWNAKRHQYEACCKAGVRSEYASYYLINPEKIVMSWPDHCYTMQKDFGQFKKDLWLLYEKEKMPMPFNEIVTKYSMDDVLGIVVVKSSKQKYDEGFAKFYQQTIKGKLSIKLPIVIYDKDKGSIQADIMRKPSDS